MFRMVWGQTETLRVRGAQRRYTDMLVGHNQPCWLLQRWIPPEMFGTPEEYYAMSADEDGLSLTGEYPQFGWYDTVVTFIEKRIDGDQLIIETIPLSYQILESLIPVLKAAQEMTEEEREMNRRAIEARENADTIELITDRLEEAMPAFFGPISYAGQHNHTGSAFVRDVEERKKRIAAEWERLGVTSVGYKPKRGLYQN
jgi:hypothetical protein